MEATGSSWLDLELRLFLVGCEEARRPGIRAARDRARPCVWDRHLAVASDPPEDPGRDVAALDGWYREGAAMRWSIIAQDHGPASGIGDAWGRELEPLDFARSTILFLEGEARVGPAPEGVRRPGPTEGLELLKSFRRQLARERGEDVGRLPQQLASALAQRSWLGWTPRVLAATDNDEVVAVIVWSVNGESGWMEDLETRDAWRGRGHGRRLFRAALGEVARAGAHRVGFSARESDWPWRWYQREGFRVVERASRFERIL